MTPRAPMCLLPHTVSAAPAWVASQSPPRVPPLPGHLRFLLLITQECVSRTWATLHPIVNTAPPLPNYTPDRLRPARCPLLRVQIHLFTFGPGPGWKCAWLLPTSSPPALTPPLPCTPAPSLPSESLCLWVGVESGSILSSALQAPGLPLRGQPGPEAEGIPGGWSLWGPGQGSRLCSGQGGEGPPAPNSCSLPASHGSWGKGTT